MQEGDGYGQRGLRLRPLLDNPGTASQQVLPCVPLLTEILALLFDSGLNPGRDVIAQLGEGVVPRRGQPAVILRRLRAGEGLEAAALGATHCWVG